MRAAEHEDVELDLSEADWSPGGEGTVRGWPAGRSHRLTTEVAEQVRQGFADLLGKGLAADVLPAAAGRDRGLPLRAGGRCLRTDGPQPRAGQPARAVRRPPAETIVDAVAAPRGRAGAGLDRGGARPDPGRRLDRPGGGPDRGRPPPLHHRLGEVVLLRVAARLRPQCRPVPRHADRRHGRPRRRRAVRRPVQRPDGRVLAAPLPPRHGRDRRAGSSRPAANWSPSPTSRTRRWRRSRTSASTSRPAARRTSTRRPWWRPCCTCWRP